MTNKFCRCGHRLSVADTDGVCLSCIERPLPEPAKYVPPPHVSRHDLPRDEQGRKLCRCGKALAVIRHGYCHACSNERVRAYRQRKREQRQQVTA